MDQFQVWVDLQDRRYAKRLSDFLSMRYGGQMQVLPVGKQTVKPDGKGVLLTDREQPDGEYGKAVLISPNQGVNPYQSGHQIAKEILERKAAGRRPDVLAKEAKGKWISVYSPVGGIGTSTLAMGLAEALAGRGRVLFLSLEGPSAWSLYFQYPLAYTISDFFYCFLIESPENREKRLEEMAARQDNGLYCMPPCLYPDDLTELSEEELLDRMQLLRCQFEFIITDLPGQMLRPLRMILMNSNEICYLLGQGPEQLAKWQNFQLYQPPQTVQRVFVRGSDKARPGEISLPEEKDIFELQQGRRRFRRGSAYYRCLEKVAAELL